MADALEPTDPARDPLEDALEEEVSRGAVRVPPYPATALKLQSVLGAENYTTQQLVEAMSADPVFTANLLRLANSPFYRRGVEVTSLSVAVQRIGARELTRLAMASTVSRLAGDVGPLHAIRRRLWRESLGSAMICEILSRFERADEGEGFVAGLLHDVGKLLVVGAIEELWHRMPELEAREEREWMQLIERFHVRFGEVLAQRWQLPGVLGAVLTSHHDWPDSLGPLTRRVVVSDAVVELMESHAGVSQEALEELGLDEAHAASMCKLIPRVPQALDAFDSKPAAPKVSLVKKPAPERPRSDALTVEVPGENSWPVTRVTSRFLEAIADKALPPNLLFELSVQPRELHFWGIVQHCEPQGTGFLVRLCPFALAPEDAKQWAALATPAVTAVAA
jgi:HD-like signal output (HDOD) protein